MSSGEANLGESIFDLSVSGYIVMGLPVVPPGALGFLVASTCCSAASP